MNGIEKSIAREVAKAIIGAGHKISVDFARGWDCEPKYRDLTDLDAIIAACDEVDECHFMLDAEHDDEDNTACATAGWVYFIWSNGDEGRTCVSDYATVLEPLLAPIWPWAEEAESMLVGEPTLTPDQLADQLRYYCEAQRLPVRDADELLHEDITPEQRRWLSYFCQRWEALIEQPDGIEQAQNEVAYTKAEG